MSRQTTLGRFGFEESISQRNSVMETKVLDYFQLCQGQLSVITENCNIIKLHCIYRCSNTKLYLSFSKSQPRLYS